MTPTRDFLDAAACVELVQTGIRVGLKIASPAREKVPRMHPLAIGGVIEDSIGISGIPHVDPKPPLPGPLLLQRFPGHRVPRSLPALALLGPGLHDRDRR